MERLISRPVFACRPAVSAPKKPGSVSWHRLGVLVYSDTLLPAKGRR